MSFISDMWKKAFTSKAKKEAEKDKQDIEAREYVAGIHLAISENKKFIQCNGKSFPINWKKVYNFTSRYSSKNYKQQKSRNPTMFVTHWDACLSTDSMIDVTKDRGLSVHFGIDNDGTIYQLLDTKNIAYHAKGVNTVSVGVEICNGVLPKYNEYYQTKGLPIREIVQGDVIHGKKMEPYLSFTSEQIEALKALTMALHKAHGIPLVTPLDKNGDLLKGVSDEVVKNTFKGVIGHYHVTTNKIDPGNLPLKEIVTELSNEILSKV